LFSFACSPIQNLTLVLSRQQDGLIYNSLAIVIKTITLIAGLYYLEAPLAIVSVFLGVSTALLFIYSLYLLRRVGIMPVQVLKITFPPLVMMFGALILLKIYIF
jgi:hypothetical protein